MENDIGKRIKMLRAYLGLNQTEFAENIGSAQNTITGYESGRRTPSSQAMALICNVYGVNMEWLKNGTGEMMAPTDELSPIVTKYGLSHAERLLIEKFLMQPPAARANITAYLTDVGRALAADDAAGADPGDDGVDVDAAVAEYRDQLLEQKKSPGDSSVSPTTKSNAPANDRGQADA